MTGRLFVSILFFVLAALSIGGCGLLNSWGAPSVYECYGLCGESGDPGDSGCANLNPTELTCSCEGVDCGCSDFDCGCLESDGECDCFDADGVDIGCTDFSN